MFQIHTYLELLHYDHTSKYYRDNPRERFVALDDTLKANKLINDDDFTPEHIQQLVSITYNDEIVVGIGAPSGLSGLSLWEHTYTPALEKYINEGKAEELYGINPIILKLENVAKAQIEISIYSEWEPKTVYTSAVLPEKEFLTSLVEGARHYFTTLLEYQVFDESNLSPRTPKDYSDRMMNRLEKLQEAINNI